MSELIAVLEPVGGAYYEVKGILAGCIARTHHNWFRPRLLSKQMTARRYVPITTLWA